MSYFQAMETPVIYKHRIAVGLGVENFLGVPFLSLDSHAAVQLEEDKCFGSWSSWSINNRLLQQR